MSWIRTRGIGRMRWIGALGVLCAVGATLVWITSPAAIAQQQPHHVGYLEVHNQTGHQLTVTYQGHEGHHNELGHVESQHSAKFQLPSCNRQYHFRATDTEHGVWTTERHCECDHTASWTVTVGHH